MKKKHKTYAESQGEKPFDWNKFLAKKTITDEEWDNASNLAKGWTTCACGNQCSIIPRYNETTMWSQIGEPMDEELSDLGFEFYVSIDERRVKSAKSILKEIESRSAYIISKIKAKK